MNKIIALSFVLSLFVGISNAQEFKVSLLTGPSLGWISSNSTQIESKGIQLGYKVHVNGEFVFKEKYTVHAGIGLSLANGGKLKYAKGGNLWPEPNLSSTIYDSLPPNTLLRYGINYVDFPFGFKLRTNPFGKFVFYVNAPEFSLGIRTKARGEIDANGLPFADKEDIRKHVGFINISYGIGIGTEYSYSEDITIIGGLRFFQSIADITDDSGRYFDNQKEDSKGILSNIDLRLGVLF